MKQLEKRTPDIHKKEKSTKVIKKEHQYERHRKRNDTMMFLFFSSVLHGNQQNRINVRYHYKELIEI